MVVCLGPCILIVANPLENPLHELLVDMLRIVVRNPHIEWCMDHILIELGEHVEDVAQLDVHTVRCGVHRREDVPGREHVDPQRRDPPCEMDCFLQLIGLHSRPREENAERRRSIGLGHRIAIVLDLAADLREIIHLEQLGLERTSDAPHSLLVGEPVLRDHGLRCMHANAVFHLRELRRLEIRIFLVAGLVALMQLLPDQL